MARVAYAFEVLVWYDHLDTLIYLFNVSIDLEGVKMVEGVHI